MFTHLYIIDRLDTTSPFWFDTPEADIPELFDTLQNSLIAAGKLTSVTRTDSPDGLKLTRTVICPSFNDFEYVLGEVEAGFPGNLDSRLVYSATVGHEVSVSEDGAPPRKIV